MIRKNKILAIIPARAGSKRIKNKNIKTFNGKPLVYWSIKVAKQSKYIDDVIVSTDSKKISNISKKFGARVPFLRSKKNSKDKSLSSSLVIEVLKKIDGEFDIIILLQPTSPLRNVNDVDRSIELLIKNKSNNVVSVIKTKAKEVSKLFLKNSSINNLVKHEKSFKFLLNGAIFVIKKDFFLKKKIFVSNNTSIWVMPNFRSIDIDVGEDFSKAQKISKTFI